MYKNLFALFVTTYTTSKLPIQHSSNLPSSNKVPFQCNF